MWNSGESKPLHIDRESGAVTILSSVQSTPKILGDVAHGYSFGYLCFYLLTNLLIYDLMLKYTFTTVLFISCICKNCITRSFAVD